jgi:hypothetical protein
MIVREDDIYPPALTQNGGLSYIIAGFGDLGPGMYGSFHHSPLDLAYYYF